MINLYAYNDELNAQATGFGPSLVIYEETGGFPQGGVQVNIDDSTTEISPQVVLDNLKKPEWMLVALVAVLIFILARK